jgi:hypothetical protein
MLIFLENEINSIWKWGIVGVLFNKQPLIHLFVCLFVCLIDGIIKTSNFKGAICT